MSPSPRRGRVAWSALVVLAATVCVPIDARAQSASVTAVKAAFIFNFARFTEWPDDVLPDGARLEMCVDGDALVAEALEQAIQHRRIESHELAVRVLAAHDSAVGCHVLFVSAAETGQVPTRLESVRSHAVLSISDNPKFTERGGVIQLRLENERMLFTINVSAAARARLQLSSKLLSLARIHREPPQ